MPEKYTPVSNKKSLKGGAKRARGRPPKEVKLSEDCIVMPDENTVVCFNMKYVNLFKIFCNNIQKLGCENLAIEFKQDHITFYGRQDDNDGCLGFFSIDLKNNIIESRQEFDQIKENALSENAKPEDIDRYSTVNDCNYYCSQDVNISIRTSEKEYKMIFTEIEAQYSYIGFTIKERRGQMKLEVHRSFGKIKKNVTNIEHMFIEEQSLDKYKEIYETIDTQKWNEIRRDCCDFKHYIKFIKKNAIKIAMSEDGKAEILAGESHSSPVDQEDILQYLEENFTYECVKSSEIYKMLTASKGINKLGDVHIYFNKERYFVTVDEFKGIYFFGSRIAPKLE